MPRTAATWKDRTVHPGLENAPLLMAARRRPGPTPVWFMRQAGRALPEYRKLREGVAMLDSCRDPDLTVEITLQPVRRFGVDAAIFFSDIVVPLSAVGIDLDIVPGTGPVIAEPVRDRAAVAAIRPLEPSDVPYTTESVSRLVEELGATPLIGFAGAPFTLASYLIEGGPSRTYAHTKALMYGEPETWHELASRLAEIARTYLQVQVAAGASAVQLCDSWAGALSEADYREYVLPHSTRVLEGVPQVPRIHFGVGTGELLAAMGEAGADVVGVDWRIPLDEAATRIGPGKAVQGNLDPTTLLAPWHVIEPRVRRIHAEGKRCEGHIFNLGHGVMPETDPDVLTRVTELVHELDSVSEER
jgi:uroporphyrinogen decarboxylase